MLKRVALFLIWLKETKMWAYVVCQVVCYLWIIFTNVIFQWLILDS